MGDVGPESQDTVRDVGQKNQDTVGCAGPESQDTVRDVGPEYQDTVVRLGKRIRIAWGYVGTENQDAVGDVGPDNQGDVGCGEHIKSCQRAESQRPGRRVGRRLVLPYLIKRQIIKVIIYCELRHVKSRSGHFKTFNLK